VDFPITLYSAEDLDKARKLIANGYRHELRVIGRSEFKRRVEATLKLIEEAGYDDFFRSYLKVIRESRGFSQLRETEASLWANIYTVEDSVEGASYFIQKAEQMKMFLEGIIHFTGEGESLATKKRVEFLRALREKTRDSRVRKECEKKIKLWEESTFF